MNPFRVLVVEEDGFWFAQGLEIDYAVQGFSYYEVRVNFEKGLEESIIKNITRHGNINNLKVAPQQFWNEYHSKNQQPDTCIYSKPISNTLKPFGYRVINYYHVAKPKQSQHSKPALTKNKSEFKDFWTAAENATKIVADWPGWKR